MTSARRFFSCLGDDVRLASMLLVDTSVSEVHSLKIMTDRLDSMKNRPERATADV